MGFLAIYATHTGHHNKSPKDHKQWVAINASAPWIDQELSIQELAEWIQQGKAWTACHLGGRSHSEDNVVASNLIVLDIDGDLTLDAFWAIPAVQRHCLFTATSYSHTPDEHRFRALFAVEAHEEVDLHGAIYDLWIERLGIQLKDNCGRKPERLWYGNDRAELRYGGGEPIPWDLVEQARDNLKAARAALPRTSPTNPEDLALDLRRAVVCFEQLLRPSVDGDFSGGYWKELLLAAAATGDEAVQQAFLQWHHRGHHSKTQTQVRRRLQRSRSRMTPGEGAGKILKLAKEQHGQLWWRLLPQELWYGSTGGGITPPTVLGRARSAHDIAPPGTTRAPDVVPSTAQLEKLAAGAKHITLGATPATSPTATPTAATPVEPATLKQKLRRLYQLRAHGILEIGDDLQEVAESERATLDRQLLGDLLTHHGYCNQPSEVDRDLLTLFRSEQGLRDNRYAEVRTTKIKGDNPKLVEWLIPGFLSVGHEHILYSKPGVGKTTLALHMARAVTGDPALDQFLDSGPLNNHHLWRRNRVIFIGTDMFDSAEEMTTQYLRDFGLLGLEFVDQMDWWFQTKDSPAWQLNLKDLTKLYRTLEGHHHNGTPVPAVFIDSMKAVCPDHLLVGQQGFKDYIVLVKQICKRFGAALIWVHHSRADGTGAQGITRITESSDANFHLKRDDNTKQIALVVEKRRGAEARTIYINPFMSIPALLPSPDAILKEDDIDDQRQRMILEVVAANFNEYRRRNKTSCAESIERNYTGMKISEIETALEERFSGRAAGLSRRTLQRLIPKLIESKKLSTIGKSRYRLPPHFQPNQADQGDLLDDTDKNSGAPGW